MGKKASVVTGATKQSRKRLRKRLECLKDNLVTPAARVRYAKAFQLFILFLRQRLGYLPANPVAYDTWLARYVEFMRHEGESKAAAASTLAGVQFFIPQLKKQLAMLDIEGQVGQS